MTMTTPKHEIHKFRDIKPKLGRDNWISWKRELTATCRDRCLYKIIIGDEPYPDTNNQNVTIVAGVQMVESTPPPTSGTME